MEALREQVAYLQGVISTRDRELEQRAEEIRRRDMALEGRYRETDEADYDLWVIRATSRKQMGEPREPERPDRSMFA